MKVIGLIYESYTTGWYGPKRNEGLCMQFSTLNGARRYHTFFNAKLRRQRSSKGHKAGDPYPPGKFYIGEQHGLYLFWKRTELQVPPRLSAFGDYLGNLKQLLFEAEVTQGNRLNATSLKVWTDRSGASSEGHSNNEQTNYELDSNKSQTNLSNKTSLQSIESKGIQANTATCPTEYVISKQVKAYTSSDISELEIVIPSKDRSTEEWIAEYEYFDALRNRAN